MSSTLYAPRHRAPKHRRQVSRVAWEAGRDVLPRDAKCGTDPKNKSARDCRDSFCPRHRPTAYADARARHATDSFPRTDTFGTRW